MNPQKKASKQASKKDLKASGRKKALRKRLLAERNSLSAPERILKSSRIMYRLMALQEYRMARTVMFFVSHGSEVITDIMIGQALRDGKHAAVPRTDPANCGISAHKVKSLEHDLEPRTYGIREPKPGSCPEVAPGKIDLVLVPGVAFDAAGHRIGYGKGYYDKWLKKFAIGKRVGICFDCQLIRSVPKTESDMPVAKIVTEKRVVEIESKGAKRK
jgi:5-formyltetrahydrofolate cyclo-ligase